MRTVLVQLGPDKERIIINLQIKEPTSDFLRLAATRQSTETLAEKYLSLGDQVIWDAARRNRVEAIVAHELMDVMGPKGLVDHWCAAHVQTQKKTSMYLDELDRLASLLDGQGIQLVLLKNGGIARGIDPCRGCCPMGDLDVLVERRHFHAVHELILGEGFIVEFRSPLENPSLEEAERMGCIEYRKELTDGVLLWLELQCCAVAGRWIRPDQEPSVEDLMARSLPIPDTAVRLLAPEDNLLQVALHTAKHSYVRAPGFRLHLDVDRIVRYQILNWNLFLSRVLDLGVRTPVYFSLAIPKALLGTSIPKEVLAALRPSNWKEQMITQWLHRIGLFNPDERKFSHLGFIVFSALLYDGVGGLCRAVFPDGKWMRQRYGFQSNLLLPAYHARRLVDLSLRRIL